MRPRFASVLFVCATLVACAAPGTKSDLLKTTLDNYAAVIRWGNFEEAFAFVDPKTREAHPLNKFDLERYAQVRVAGYTEQPLRRDGENEVRQTVEITLSNNNTQAVRSVIDRQLWRYDEKAKRWWLVSGLPDISQR